MFQFSVFIELWLVLELTFFIDTSRRHSGIVLNLFEVLVSLWSGKVFALNVGRLRWFITGKMVFFQNNTSFFIQPIFTLHFKQLILFSHLCGDWTINLIQQYLIIDRPPSSKVFLGVLYAVPCVSNASFLNHSIRFLNGDRENFVSAL